MFFNNRPSKEGNYSSLPSDPNEKQVISAENLSISFRSHEHKSRSLKETVISGWKSKSPRAGFTFQALDRVTFHVNRGEVFGVIGSNGAGKTTLLKALSGVLRPSQGNIVVRGRVDSFIQLGAGFDPELNAIENIYLNCSLHGLNRKQIAERVPDILSFAELGEFANTPLKYYSSGMFARLGFSVAIDRNPDILVVDEVLAVGDDRFRTKCNQVFVKAFREKKTIILVSHSMDLIRNHCKRAALLEQGRLAFVGDVEEAIAHYVDPNYKTRLSA